MKTYTGSLIGVIDSHVPESGATDYAGCQTLATKLGEVIDQHQDGWGFVNRAGAITAMQQFLSGLATTINRHETELRLVNGQYVVLSEMGRTQQFGKAVGGYEATAIARLAKQKVNDPAEIARTISDAYIFRVCENRGFRALTSTDTLS